MDTLRDTCLDQFTTKNGEKGQFYSLKKLADQGFPNLHQLPVSIRIVLESILRNCDGEKVTQEHIQQLASWQANAERTQEIPFIVARVVLQDFTGVPLLADLAAMRNVAHSMGKDPKKIEPLVPVDLVVDHSIMIDHYGTPDALTKNMKIEFERNQERYQFLKWGMQAFDTFGVVPPGIGIVHQVNLEYLFRGVRSAEVAGQETDQTVYYPDTLVGTDSHTTMINGVGVVGWGVGGIEAEAGMLGQPVYFLTPDVVGVELTGSLNEGITATDLVLTITELLRSQKVVGKFVEFYGPGAASLSVTDRATLANMAPEYGATMGFFPPDAKTVEFMRKTGRTDVEADRFEAYFQAQGLLGMPDVGSIQYSQVVKLNLDTVEPSLAGPKRPQDRIKLSNMRSQFESLFSAPTSENGFAKKPDELNQRFETGLKDIDIGNGDVLIAAITSCTNTSNPGVLLGAGLLAKKAVEQGLSVHPRVKTSLGPGSRVVSDYLSKTGLQTYLDQLGFNVAAYGCTTCIGNAGDLKPEFNEALNKNELVGCAVLSGNRNFEARIHPNIKANFLASPPLVVAFALAGKANIDLTNEPLGQGTNGPVYLKDIWPSSEEINELLPFALDPATFKRLYSDFNQGNDLWNQIPAPEGQVYSWPDSSYIAMPPFFEEFNMTTTPVEPIEGARPLLIMGDSVTTDHISPAGSFKAETPAGKYLQNDKGVQPIQFNSYGSRRGNHDVMIRGTFANVRVKNLMIPPAEDGKRVEGGFTLKDGKQTTVYEAAQEYLKEKVPTVILAGEEYGTGSSRDWAAKGTQLLGVRAVIAKSFERIHRSNLVGMGVLPLQFAADDSVESLNLDGTETYSIVGLDEKTPAQAMLTLRVTRANGDKQDIPVKSRIDTPIEVAYFKHKGILPYVLRELLAD